MSWHILPSGQLLLPNLRYSLMGLLVFSLGIFAMNIKKIIAWSHLSVAQNQTLHLQHQLCISTAIFLFGIILNPQKWILPVLEFSRHAEDYSSSHSALEFSPREWAPFSLYNAIFAVIFTVCMLTAYTKLLESSFASMDAMGVALVQMKKEKDMESGRVSFQLPEQSQNQQKHRNSIKTSHKLLMAAFFLAISVRFLPSACRQTFYLTILQTPNFAVTLDDICASLIAVFSINLIHELIGNFENTPVGFPKGKLALANFSIVYGFILAAATTFFLVFAHDIMHTYIFKVFELYYLRIASPDALAHDIVMAGANHFTTKCANYLVDSTFGDFDAELPKEEALRMLHVLIELYNSLFIDLVQLLAFGCMVFVPVVLGLLVLADLR